MDQSIFYSDVAIIIYELIIIAILVFFILKLMKEKKERMHTDIYQKEMKQELLLKEKLENKKRR